jgi:hypothetical protein
LRLSWLQTSGHSVRGVCKNETRAICIPSMQALGLCKHSRKKRSEDTNDRSKPAIGIELEDILSKLKSKVRSTRTNELVISERRHQDLCGDISTYLNYIDSEIATRAGWALDGPRVHNRMEKHLNVEFTRRSRASVRYLN